MLFKFFFVKIKAFIFYKDSDYKHFLIFFVLTETKAKTSLFSNVLGYRFCNFYDRICCTLWNEHNS